MILIDASTRQIKIPASDLVFGVEADAGSAVKQFQCPRYVGNNIDLAGSFIRVNWRNVLGYIDSYLVKNVSIDGDNVIFDWELTPAVTTHKGTVKFVVCVVGADTKLKWHTTLGSGQVLEGLEPDGDTIENETADVVAQLISLVESQVAEVTAEGDKQILAVQTATQAAQAAAVAQIQAQGASTLASIPADYTALSTVVDTLTRERAPCIVCEAAGTAIVVNDASNLAIQGLRLFGRSIQDGSPTPEAPVEIVSVVEPVVTVCRVSADEEDAQTISIPRTLPGIPVTSGGNYTDGDGQQWICDEVDFERGVYVQRITNTKVVPTEMTDETVSEGYGVYRVLANMPVPYKSYPELTCSHFASGSSYNEIMRTTHTIGLNSTGQIIVNYMGFQTANELKNFIETNDFVLNYPLATPVETALTEPELAAYRALHSNYPNTTVLNNAGTHMVVKYAADTKRYIDNKIAALSGI